MANSGTIRVGINGFGTIGKRAADAVRAQPDMELVGVTAHSNSYRVQSAQVVKKIPIFMSTLRGRNADFEEMQRRETQAAIDDLKSVLDMPIRLRKLATEKTISRMNLLTAHLSANDFEEDAVRFKANNIELQGGLDDLLEACDVIIDCTPKPFGQINKPVYAAAGTKAIYQGGEKSDVGEVSFVAQANYDQAVGKDHVRVVSCNTTGPGRGEVASPRQPISASAAMLLAVLRNSRRFRPIVLPPPICQQASPYDTPAWLWRQ